MSPFRGVYTLKCTAPLDHHQAVRGFNGEPVLRHRLRYLNSWHSLVRHVRVRADLRVLYHTEWEKTQAFSGTDSTLYSVIASNGPRAAPRSARARDETPTAKSVKAASTSHWWWRCSPSGALVRFGKVFEKPATSGFCKPRQACMTVGDVKCGVFRWK